MAQADRCQDPEHQAERLPDGQLICLPHHVHWEKRTYETTAMPCQSTRWSDPDTVSLSSKLPLTLRLSQYIPFIQSLHFHRLSLTFLK